MDTWPSVTLVGFAFFVFCFRREIAGIMARIRGIDSKFISVSTGDRQEEMAQRAPEGDALRTLPQQPEAIPTGRNLQAEEYFQSRLLLEQAAHLDNYLHSLGLENANEREAFLLKFSASCQIALMFEETYRLIYGSQLIALQALAGHDKSIMTAVDNLRPFYHQGASMGLNHESVSFDAWLWFLTHTVLTAREDEQIGITVRGKEFLKYLVERGYPLIKGGGINVCQEGVALTA